MFFVVYFIWVEKIEKRKLESTEINTVNAQHEGQQKIITRSRIVYTAFIANEPIYLIGGGKGRRYKTLAIKVSQTENEGSDGKLDES